MPCRPAVVLTKVAPEKLFCVEAKFDMVCWPCPLSMYVLTDLAISWPSSTKETRSLADGVQRKKASTRCRFGQSDGGLFRVEDLLFGMVC
jgi:hypothetical protein